MNKVRMAISMQERKRLSTIIVTTTLFLSLFGMMLSVQAGSTASGTISTNTEWSGDIILTDNVYVEHGVTLTLKSGAAINADIYSIIVDGTLIGTNAALLSTSTSDAGNHSSNIGLWKGIEVNSGGVINLTNVDISNAKSGLMIHGSATLDAVSIEDSYVGVDVDGTANIVNLTCQNLNFECLRVSGVVGVDGLIATAVAGGISSSGDLDITNVSIDGAGTAISISAGSGDYSSLIINDSSTAVIVRGTTSVAMEDLLITSTVLVLDAGDSEGFSLSNATADCSRAVRAQGITSLSVTDSTFNGSRDGNSMIYVSVDGQFTMTNVDITNASTAFDLRGSGEHALSAINAEAEDLVMSATGTGLLSADGLSLGAESQGVRISGPNLIWQDVEITGGLTTSLGMRIATGTHEITNLEISRSYLASDQDSLALELIWATLDSTTIQINNYGNGLRVDSSTLTATDISISNGSNTGLEIDDGSIQVADTLSTSLADLGAKLSESAILHVSTWNSNLHDDVLEIGPDAIVTIRYLEFGNTAGFDALGDGTLVWGGNTTPSLAMSNEFQMQETIVKTVDLSGVALAASVSVEGFTFDSDSSGLVSLPLRISGSLVVAISGSAGAQDTLMGGVADQELALPAIPDGDWVISSGNHVVLGASLDESGHFLVGNLTIETGASLTLKAAALNLLSNKTFTTEGTGKLIGSNGALIGGTTVIDTQQPIDSEDGELSIVGDVFWNCTSPSSISSIQFVGQLVLGDGCTVSLTSGNIASAPSLGTGASLLMKSQLDITVLDKGEAIEGALISISGTNLQTDANGQVSHLEDAAFYEESGITWGGMKTVSMQSNGLLDMMMWDTNSTRSKTFLASTIASGNQDDWIILEAAWSPYYLADDLTISETATLTLHDNAQLIIANDVAITLEGTITAGAGTIQSSGASPWSGITMEGAQAKLNLVSTHLLGAVLPVVVNGGVIVSEGAEIASGTDGLISATYSDLAISITLTDTDLRYGGQNCIRVAGTGVELNIQDSTLTECGDYALWATLSILDIDGLNIEGGSNTGVNLADVEGSITNLNASSHTGTNSSIELSEQDDKLILRDLILTPASRAWPCAFDASDIIVFSAINDGFANCIDGSDEVMNNHTTGYEMSLYNCGDDQMIYISQVNDGISDCENGSDEILGNTDAAFMATHSRWLDVSGLSISGAPAVNISYSAGLMSGLTLTGSGVGTAVLIHHNRGSGSLTIQDSTITGYTTALRLNGDSGDELNEAFSSISNTWDATTAVLSEDLEFTSQGDTFTGSIAYNSTASAQAVFLDSTYSSITVSDNAKIIAWESFQLQFMLFGTTLDASAQISIPNPDDGTSFSFSNQGASWNLNLPVFIAAESGNHDLGSANITALGPNSLPFSSSIDLSSASERNIVFNLTGNVAPTTHISSPDEGQRFSILSNVSFEGIATDGESSVDKLSHSWKVIDSTGTIIWQSLEQSPTWEILEIGEFNVAYTVLDEHGLATTSSVAFSVIQNDADGDWLITCDEEQWFDMTNGNKCGYDEVDADDDNDGIIDTLDKWPLDPCADADVDNDMKPDEVDCPTGVTTDLVEDDNVQITTPNLSVAGDNIDTGVLVGIALVLVIIVAIINRMRSTD